MQKYLELQRASAGSGKTYSLAKKFLWLYLTIRDEDGQNRRLRTPAELRDSLRHILAVTFTNKATTEMQQRIIEKLFLLAFSKKEPAKIDYLIDFCKALKGTNDVEKQDIEELQNVCRIAIYILLENYSDFQVSTIDSFFQLVLRTFAYETELNDSYGIELDSEFLSKMGIDSVFEDIEENRASREVTFWLDEMMKNSRKTGNGWNIFQRRESKGPYSEFINSLKKLQNEDFKDIRGQIENYFNNNSDFIALYEDLCNKYDTLPAAPHRKMIRDANKVLNLTKIWSEPLPPFLKSIKDHADKILKSKSALTPVKEFKPKTKFDGATTLKIRKENEALFDELVDEYRNMINSMDEWQMTIMSPEFRHWQIYKKQFPLLGLLSVTLRKREEYLEENNNVELSETNSLLRQIIGKDDTPFIYERLGTKLNHFLIDEFQDTSRLQWVNFKPLLDESIGRGQENLLIGDAKQSIYRFRNADPSLISYKVQQTYPGLTPIGDEPKDNTNHRSDLNIVDFNNRLFRFLSSAIEDDKLTKLNEKSYTPNFDFRKLYSNVVQNFKDDNKRGYVSLNIIESNSDAFTKCVCSELLCRIEDILSRGFSMGDIAVLVDKNEQADLIIRTFLEYNSNPENALKLEFISEESLKLKSSPAVNIILSTLETISRGTDHETPNDKNEKRRSVNWDKISSNFRLYCIKNGKTDTAMALEEFLNDRNSSDAISEMLSSMQAVTLPALVESVAASFLPENIRQENAPYIAAFQDVVLEYCDSHPSDIPSFLDWWQKRQNKFSISSPEGLDAINVMTIHKSKGLEFPCVLIPFADCNFNNTNPKKKEWSWVQPEVIDASGHNMPPFIPVDTDSSLIGTAHEGRFWKFVEMSSMDNLNKFYVAFTRAVHELYIFCRKGLRQSTSSFSSLMDSFLETDEINFCHISQSEGFLVFETGKKWAPTDIKNLKENEERKNKTAAGYATLEDYDAHNTPGFLKYRDADAPAVIEADNLEEDDIDNGPRSEGNIYHAIMQRIAVPEDIPMAVAYHQRRGLYSRDEAKDIISFLRKRLTGDNVKDWFNGSYRIINERPVISDSKIKRPDRIIVDNNRNAIVIDYKFGKKRDDKKYGRQVKGYIDKLKETGRFSSVKGYVWYVRNDEILFVGN